MLELHLHEQLFALTLHNNELLKSCEESKGLRSLTDEENTRAGNYASHVTFQLRRCLSDSFLLTMASTSPTHSLLEQMQTYEDPCASARRTFGTNCLVSDCTRV